MIKTKIENRKKHLKRVVKENDPETIDRNMVAINKKRKAGLITKDDTLTAVKSLNSMMSGLCATAELAALNGDLPKALALCSKIRGTAEMYPAMMIVAASDLSGSKSNIIK